MRVPHLYLAGPWSGDSLTIDSAPLHHVRRVLRLDDGAGVTYSDGRGTLGEGVLVGAEVVRGEETVQERSGPRLTIGAAPPRGADRARFMVEKLAELGVEQLIWLATARGETRAPRPAKVQSWLRGALEQSRGAWIMEVDGPRAPVGPWPDSALVLECSQHGEPPPPDWGKDQLIVGLIGPAGGFVDGEVPASARTIKLATTVLRTETAAIACAAVVRSSAVGG